jgi:hypothetical protein
MEENIESEMTMIKERCLKHTWEICIRERLKLMTEKRKNQNPRNVKQKNVNANVNNYKLFYNITTDNIW